MSQEWRELEPGVWGKSTTNGVDLIVEEITDSSSQEPVYEASQLQRTCCSFYRVPAGRFKSREEAMVFLDALVE